MSGELLPLDTNDQKCKLHDRVMRLRALLSEAEGARKVFVSAQNQWKECLIRAEDAQEHLGCYVSKRRTKVVVDLDEDTVCLIRFDPHFGSEQKPTIDFLLKVRCDDSI